MYVKDFIVGEKSTMCINCFFSFPPSTSIANVILVLLPSYGRVELGMIGWTSRRSWINSRVM